MTKEEAVNQLQDAKEGYKEYLTDEALDMAIKALDQQPCDAVSREELLAHVEDLGVATGVTEGFIDRMSSVQPTQEWIPVSERLPEPKEGENTILVLVVIEGGMREKPYLYRDMVVYAKDLSKVSFSGFSKKSGFYDSDSEDYYEVYGVLYWMPLPELPPYQKEEG